MKWLRVFTLTLVASLTSIGSIADLLISPTRAVLNERDRTQTIYLINSGSEARNYRIEWRQLKALPEGGYRELTEQEKEQYSGLEKIVRISPKQVSLQPGQRQSVKLLLRNPGNLPVGEYRSHLAFSALPIQEDEQNTGQTVIKLDVLVSYSMPIIYRVGTTTVAPAIEDISILYKKELQKHFLKVNLYHNDKFSTHGRLVAFWTPENGKRRQVALLNNYNLYPEVTAASIEIPWPNFTIAPGKLEVRYEGTDEFNGYLLAEKYLTITQSMVNSIK